MFLGTVHFGNDHVAAILGYGDLQWGNILITRVYFTEGFAHILFSIEQFCDSDLEAEVIAITCYTQNRSIIHRRFDKTPYELINGRKLDISFLYVFRALCYPKNNREDIGKLGAKGDIEFFIGYSTTSFSYRLYNRRTKKIMKTMNVIFDELSRLELTYTPSTITSQKPTESELELLFKAMYDDYIGGKPLAAPRTTLKPQVLQTPTTSRITINTVPTPSNSSPQATAIPNTLQDVDELEQEKQHVQQQDDQAQLQSKTIADNVLNAMLDGNMFINPFAPPSKSDAESSSSEYDGSYQDIFGIRDTQIVHCIPNRCENYFLACSLKEDVYLCQPKGFIDADHPSHVYKLKKALYGLKQAPRACILDVVHATCLCARYQAKPTEKHLIEMLIMRVVEIPSRVLPLLREKLVSWSLKKQDCTLLSTAEAEYVSLYACCAQVLWMRTQLTDYGFHFNKIPIYCDSKSAISISCNPVQHSRTKHIIIRYHLLKEHIEKGTIELYFVKTGYQLADLFTKALPLYRFNYLVRRLGMQRLSPQELERLAKS
nr:copia protein [Tanacetum cinerariifolium]